MRRCGITRESWLETVEHDDLLRGLGNAKKNVESPGGSAERHRYYAVRCAFVSSMKRIHEANAVGRGLSPLSGLPICE